MRYSYSYFVIATALGVAACDVQPGVAEAAPALHADLGDQPEVDCNKCPHAAEMHAQAAPEAKPQLVDIELGSAPVRGEASAPITIVVYSDFECPFCRRGAARIDELTEKYGADVRVAFKNYPLPFHTKASRAAAAAVAAQNQGKFWEMHDRLFADGAAIDEEALLGHARALGLDVARFQRDLDDPATKARVAADIAEGEKHGVRGTPTFFVSGEPVVGAQPLAAFAPAIERARARR